MEMLRWCDLERFLGTTLTGGIDFEPALGSTMSSSGMGEGEGIRYSLVPKP